MSELFSTLIGAAIGTPASRVETATPLLQPRFAAIEPLAAVPEGLAPPFGAADGAENTPPMLPTPAFALDFPAASAAQHPTPALSTEAVQAGQAPIIPVLPSEAPAPMRLTPALAAQNPASALAAQSFLPENAPFLPENAPLSAAPAPVLLPISAPDSAFPTPFAAAKTAESEGYMQLLPSQTEAAAAERAPLATATPSIAIHIGRIEVAAPMPAAAPATRSTSAAEPAAARTIPRAAPRQSLDSYLAGRRR